ncbi:unnamed protein product [Strongylus vulgaris]|uniref:Uncharacterized protein n=1 Tax=Strongylus vulgaris TaxID=40348 RepID=A0A3P7J4T7_STRVU|nr:unnamed protein product [Strongylus vulgaris]
MEIKIFADKQVCGSKVESVLATKQGVLNTPEGKRLSYTVPKEENINDQEFQCLKEDISNLLFELGKDSGSVTRKEVSALRQKLRAWSKPDERAVIIDSLNVFHGSARGFGPLVELTNRLADEYKNAILVTRPFLFEKLKSVRWRGNVRTFSCTTL